MAGYLQFYYFSADNNLATNFYYRDNEDNALNTSWTQQYIEQIKVTLLHYLNIPHTNVTFNLL